MSQQPSTVSVVIVHYRTPELARMAIEAVTADAARAGCVVEGILVDNGSDAGDRALLESLPFARVDPGANLGFAGGVNLGVARATAPTIVVMNPDVEVLPGCLSALLATVAGRPAIAGPRFYWDRERRFVLPPAEVRSRWGELLALLASRSTSAAGAGRRRWRRHARRHWRAAASLPSHALSGGLLAFSRAAWDRIGPFDPGYRLYFEETDWLKRAARLGVPAFYVPAAEAVHLHGRSAVAEPQAGLWFEESARLYRRRHYGASFEALLDFLARRLPPPRLRADRAATLRRVGGTDGYNPPVWVEVSPNPTGYPAAAEYLAAPVADWRWPAELEQRLAGEALEARAVDDSGRELGPVDLRRPAPDHTAGPVAT